MGHFLLQSRFSLNATEFTGHIASVTSTHSQAEIDDTVFGDLFENCIAGLERYEQAITLLDDLTDNEVNEDIFACWAVNTSGPGLAVLYGYLQSATEGVTNPEYGYTGLLLSSQDVGAVGEGAKLQLSVKLCSGTLTRDVT